MIPTDTGLMPVSAPKIRVAVWKVVESWKRLQTSHSKAGWAMCWVSPKLVEFSFLIHFCPVRQFYQIIRRDLNSILIPDSEIQWPRYFEAIDLTYPSLPDHYSLISLVLPLFFPLQLPDSSWKVTILTYVYGKQAKRRGMRIVERNHIENPKTCITARPKLINNNAKVKSHISALDLHSL
jgi:hypothetical protein